MSDGDRSAERPVAGEVTQNTNQAGDPRPTFCNRCEREITRRDPIWVTLRGCFCSEMCAKLAESPPIEAGDPFNYGGGEPRSRLPAEPFADIAPHQSASPTSRAAAEANAPTMRSKMYLIYTHIRQQGLHGATRQEIADDLAIPLQTVCGRVRRLYQMGLIGSNPGHVRASTHSGLANEVMLHEAFVDRWNDDQARPPIRPSWERGE